MPPAAEPRRTAFGLLLLGILAPGAVAGASVEPRGRLDLGYRFAELDWNIAGTPAGTSPNVASELTWTDLGVLQLELGGELLLERHFWVGGSIAGGAIRAGENRDSDYLGDDRTFEFSRSENGADSGDILEADVGLGYAFRVPASDVRTGFDIVVAGGYAMSTQDLRLVDGVQTVADEDLFGEPLPPLGPFYGLNSSYDARWDGPWIGTEAAVLLSERSRLTGRLRLHRADYEAEANWNLREDFAHPVSFEHFADGDGLTLRAGYGRRAARSGWGWQVLVDYQRFSTDAGLDRVYFSDGTFLDTRLNEANWSSLAVALGFTLGPGANRVPLP